MQRGKKKFFEPDAVPGAKLAKTAHAAGAAPRTPLGKTAYGAPHSWIKERICVIISKEMKIGEEQGESKRWAGSLEIYFHLLPVVKIFLQHPCPCCTSTNGPSYSTFLDADHHLGQGPCRPTSVCRSSVHFFVPSASGCHIPAVCVFGRRGCCVFGRDPEMSLRVDQNCSL